MTIFKAVICKTLHMHTVKEIRILKILQFEQKKAIEVQKGLDSVTESIFIEWEKPQLHLLRDFVVIDSCRKLRGKEGKN